jgi:hypothetical protein
MKRIVPAFGDGEITRTVVLDTFALLAAHVANDIDSFKLLLNTYAEDPAEVLMMLCFMTSHCNDLLHALAARDGVTPESLIAQAVELARNADA